MVRLPLPGDSVASRPLSDSGGPAAPGSAVRWVTKADTPLTDNFLGPFGASEETRHRRSLA